MLVETPAPTPLPTGPIIAPAIPTAPTRFQPGRHPRDTADRGPPPSSVPPPKPARHSQSVAWSAATGRLCRAVGGTVLQPDSRRAHRRLVRRARRPYRRDRSRDPRAPSRPAHSPTTAARRHLPLVTARPASPSHWHRPGNMPPGAVPPASVPPGAMPVASGLASAAGPLLAQFLSGTTSAGAPPTAAPVMLAAGSELTLHVVAVLPTKGGEIEIAPEAARLTGECRAADRQGARLYARRPCRDRHARGRLDDAGAHAASGRRAGRAGAGAGRAAGCAGAAADHQPAAGLALSLERLAGARRSAGRAARHPRRRAMPRRRRRRAFRRPGRSSRPVLPPRSPRCAAAKSSSCWHRCLPDASFRPRRKRW